MIQTPRKRRIVSVASDLQLKSYNDILKQYLSDSRELLEKIKSFLLCWYGKAGSFKIINVESAICAFSEKYLHFEADANNSDSLKALKEHQELSNFKKLLKAHSKIQNIREMIEREQLFDYPVVLEQDLGQLDTLLQSCNSYSHEELVNVLKMEILKIKSSITRKIENYIEQTFKFSFDENFAQLTVYDPQHNVNIMDKNMNILTILQLVSVLDISSSFIEKVLSSYFLNIIFPVVDTRKVLVKASYSQDKNTISVLLLDDTDGQNTFDLTAANLKTIFIFLHKAVFGAQDRAHVITNNEFLIFLADSFQNLVLSLQQLVKIIEPTLISTQKNTFYKSVAELIFLEVKIPQETQEKIFIHIDFIEYFGIFGSALEANKNFLHKAYKTLDAGDDDSAFSYEATNSASLIRATFLKEGPSNQKHFKFFEEDYTFPPLLSKKCSSFLVSIFDFLEIAAANNELSQVVASFSQEKYPETCVAAPKLEAHSSTNFDSFPALKMKKDTKTHTMSKISTIHDAIQVFLSILSISWQKTDSDRIPERMLLYSDCISVSRFIALLPSCFPVECYSSLNLFDSGIAVLQERYNRYYTEIVGSVKSNLIGLLNAITPELIFSLDPGAKGENLIAQITRYLMNILGYAKLYLQGHQFDIMSDLLISLLSDTLWACITATEADDIRLQFKKAVHKLYPIKSLAKYLSTNYKPTGSFNKLTLWIDSSNQELE